MEIKNIKKTAQRIQKAIKNQERIILYGDADLDGITSTIILKESIKNLGGEVREVYFPDREKDGYGLNRKALDILQKEAPALLILLDCGISNFQEIESAKKIGFEVIIIDHHEVLDKLPTAAIIVDPKQPEDDYPFKVLATAGIIFKLFEALFKKKISTNLRNSFLELVALATIADMMPQTEENKVMIEEGLNSLKKTFRPGLKAFLEINNAFEDRSIKEISQMIISALSSGEKQGYQNTTYLLLTSNDEKEAKNLARDLIERGYQKQTRIREITAEVEEATFKKMVEPLVFEGSTFWQLSLLGSVASRICQKYQKPAFIFKKGEKGSMGAVRTPANVNGVEAMKSCSELLKTFGGHPLAAGFTIENENLEKFKDCLTKYLQNL